MGFIAVNEEILFKFVIPLIMTILGVAFTISVFFIKAWFTKSEQDREALARKVVADKEAWTDKLLKISDNLSNLEKKNIAHLAKFDKNQTENHLALAYKIDLILRDQGKIEGRLDDHINMISSHISTMRNMADKMDAMFRFIDANPRATDMREAK